MALPAVRPLGGQAFALSSLCEQPPAFRPGAASHGPVASVHLFHLFPNRQDSRTLACRYMLPVRSVRTSWTKMPTTCKIYHFPMEESAMRNLLRNRLYALFHKWSYNCKGPKT
ncbi:hypothetical protein MPNT_200045 [Candidatus Methylacidithermus pantelleriae]|uniref:Uncharacterized protein n=1 Tax=Candidatus Methylacidithermus pantelleriae TaxID=2744239 RepID=A0A8J2BT64_9BACT|nr:hypothetical protein MPNT_200045 [Candidatus Methylacidithermus pantelleriae]